MARADQFGEVGAARGSPPVRNCRIPNAPAWLKIETHSPVESPFERCCVSSGFAQ
jgi:hypothetical protein